MKFHKSTLALGYAGLALSLSLTPLSANPDSPVKPAVWQKHMVEINQQLKVNPEKARDNQAQIATCLRTIRMSLAAEDYQQAITQLNNLRNLEPSAVKPILALSEKLIDELVARSKQELTRTETLYTEFAEAIMAAKQAHQIDPWIKKLNVEVSRAQTRNRTINPLKVWTPIISDSANANVYQSINRGNQLFNMNTSHLTQLQSKASQALQIAHYWQDYLHYLKVDNTSSARSSMNRIAQVVVNFTYIPRSKVLDLQSGLIDDNQVTQKIASLSMDNLKKRLVSHDEALLLYDELRHAPSSLLTPAIRALSNKLQEYNSACEYLEGGDIDDGFYKIRALMFHPILGTLSQQTHDKYLQLYLKIPADFTQSKKEESATWATRYMLQLSKDKAWKELHVALVFMQQYYYRTNSSSNAPIKQDMLAITYLLVGMNYEANQQYMRAIAAYRQAVGTLGYCTEVVSEAGKRLRKLQQAHPTEFAQSQSLRSHDGTSNSFTTSPLLIRKIVKEELENDE